jgi:type I restriction enzyme M protein
MYAKMKKSLGNKRVYLTEEQISEVVKVYAGQEDGATFANEFEEPQKGVGHGVEKAGEPEVPRVASKIFDSEFFGYRKVTVDRPPQDGKAVGVKLKKGQKPYDPDLRDTENIALSEGIAAYMKREVLPHVPDAYVNTDIVDEKDGGVGKVGYEINFNRYFYVYKAPRKPEVIAAEIRDMEKRFLELMKGVLA